MWEIFGGTSMKIGYASQTVGIPGVKFKTTRLKNVTEEKLIEIIQSNLNSLHLIFDYNIKNNIQMFRISSDIIPFGSHEVNTLKWWEIFEDDLATLGKKAQKNNMRLSMHPGQYTVLNSLDEEVVKRATEDLLYHTRFLDALNIDASNKIILHIGGVYGDKKTAMNRFVENYKKLNEGIQQRLVIENDDRQYTISEVLSIGNKVDIPVVFDNLHHASNPDHTLSEFEWIMESRKTWSVKDGCQKIHYSQQDPNKRLGAHSRTIAIDEFYAFYSQLPTKDIDVMFEVKDKNLSAMKGNNLLATPHIKYLEKEWERYKYWILEHSPKIYNEIRQLLKDKESYPIIKFYDFIDKALETPATDGTAVNAAQHVWGYVDDITDEKTKANVEKNMEKVAIGGSTRTLKKLLWKLARTKGQSYLLNSLYFSEIY